jgi:hypothetical protein
VLFLFCGWHVWTEAGRQRQDGEASYVKPLRMTGGIAALAALSYGIAVMGHYLHQMGR